MSILAPFQLLELNIISAQDLYHVSRNMRTYAVSWVHPDRKLTTRVDTSGRTNPTWNDKFVFRVDEEFLYSDTSAVMIEIYALHWFRDVHVGTVRVLVGNLIPPPTRPHHSHYPHLGMRFVALQVRRPSGRPQGILNIGVALLDSSMRSMPLYTQLDASAVGYRHLMGETDPHMHQHSHGHDHHGSQTHHTSTYGKPELRRTKSDTSSMIESGALVSKQKPKKKKASSVIGSTPTPRSSKTSSVVSGSGLSKNGKKVKSGDSIINGAEAGDPPKKGKKDPPKKKKKNGKSSSKVNGSETEEPPKIVINQVNSKGVFGSIITNSEVVNPPKKKKYVKPGSIANGSDESEDPPKKVSNEAVVVASPKGVHLHDSPFMKFNGMEFGSPYKPVMGLYGLEYGTPRRPKFVGRPIVTESELGPSPSEVAAEMARNSDKPVEETESSAAGGVSVESSSVEGLQSKLERWRSELPPVYDIGELSFPTSSRRVNGNGNGNGNSSVNGNSSKHNRRHTDGGGGLFSCFSNICGCECSIVCGSGPSSKSGSMRNKGGNSGRSLRSPNKDDISYM